MMMIFLWILAWFAESPTPDYRKIFEDHYEQAQQYLTSIKPSADSVFTKYNQDGEILLATVFPELLRYSMILDYLETTSLELVYVNTGIPDFSIGRFQIKPSFAEKIEAYFPPDGTRNSEISRLLAYNSTDQPAIRRMRIERLKSVPYQLLYISAFGLVINERFPDLEKKNNEYRIKFVSTAYNHDFEADKAEIEDYIPRKFFPWGANKSGNRFAYSEISWFFFKDYFCQN